MVARDRIELPTRGFSVGDAQSKFCMTRANILGTRESLQGESIKQTATDHFPEVL